MWDAIWLNGRLATMAAGGVPYGAHENAAIATEDGRIAWLGRCGDLAGEPHALARDVHDLDGRWLGVFNQLNHITNLP